MVLDYPGCYLVLCHVSNWCLVVVIDLGIGFWYAIWEGENFHRTKRIVTEREWEQIFTEQRKL
jgi:hypothetical protein